MSCLGWKGNLSYLNTGYKIAHQGPFLPKQIEITQNHDSAIIDKDVEAYIKQIWERDVQKQKHRRLFNGKLFHLQENFVLDDVLKLAVTDSDYTHYYVSRDPRFAERFGRAHRVNPLSVGGVVETSDGKILFGTRCMDLDINAGMISVPAGAMDPEKDVIGDHPNAVHALLREIREETGIPEESVYDSRCLGLIESEGHRQSYLAFFSRANISSGEVESMKRSNREFSDIFCVPFEEMLTLMRQDGPRMAPNCIANIKLVLDMQSQRRTFP